MRVRAESAEATRQRILEVASDMLRRRWYGDVTLEEIAREAGVTVQTVIRRFGSKDGIVEAAIEEEGPKVRSQRAQAPVGDVPAAVRVLADHYEAFAEFVMRVLAQEERVPAMGRLAQAGRLMHREWVERTFEPFLRRGGVVRLAQLLALTDVYTWTLLRRELSRHDTEKAMVEMIEGVIDNG